MHATGAERSFSFRPSRCRHSSSSALLADGVLSAASMTGQPLLVRPFRQTRRRNPDGATRSSVKLGVRGSAESSSPPAAPEEFKTARELPFQALSLPVLRLGAAHSRGRRRESRPRRPAAPSGEEGFAAPPFGVRACSRSSYVLLDRGIIYTRWAAEFSFMNPACCLFCPRVEPPRALSRTRGRAGLLHFRFPRRASGRCLQSASDRAPIVLRL